MSLSTNQKITLSIAGAAVVLSFVFSSVSLCFSWDQKKQNTSDRISRCNDAVAQFQSDLSTKSDGILKEAAQIRLGPDSNNIRLDDLLIEYRRFVRLFEKKQTCNAISNGAIQKLTGEIDSIREANRVHSRLKLNALLGSAKSLAQDASLSSSCCH